MKDIYDLMRNVLRCFLNVPIFISTFRNLYMLFQIFTAWNLKDILPSSEDILGVCKYCAWRILWVWISLFFSNMFSTVGSQPWWYFYIIKPMLYSNALFTVSTQRWLKIGLECTLLLTPAIMRITFFL